MSDLIREHGLSRASVHDALTRSLGVDRVEVAGEGWRLVNNDCVPEVASMPGDSVGLVVTSIPFSNHYEYTPAYEDLGFTESNDHFWAQMDFLTPELLRVLQPGRIYACHVKDRILFGNVTGAGIPTSSPFHAEAITHGLKHGFDYLGMVTVVTDGRGVLPSTFMALAPGSHHPMVRYSNEGETVFDPFSGLGTVPLRALALDRVGVGVELNPGYFLDAVKYLEAEARTKGMPTLFDALDEAAA